MAARKAKAKNRSAYDTVRRFNKKLATLPISVAEDVARRAAPELTKLALDAYNSGRSVYGGKRPGSIKGGALTLRDTGDTIGSVRFETLGTVVRCVLPTDYARYLIGRYGILPNGILPASWARRLTQLVDEAEVDL